MELIDKITGYITGDPQPERTALSPEYMTPPLYISFQPSAGADYPESFYRHQTEIRKVSSHADMIKFIESARLSRSAKDALNSLAANLYDDNVILSFHAVDMQAEIAYLKAKVFLRAFTQAKARKSDVMNPVWGLVINQLFYQLELRFTRTVSGDRERIVQGKIVQQHEITQGYQSTLTQKR